MASGPGRSSSPKLGKVTQTFAHSGLSQGKEGPWPRWGLKQAAVLCMPSWGAGQGGCHGNGPSASEERSKIWPQRPCLAPLFFADKLWATSPEPPPSFSIIFPRQAEP